MGEEVCGRGRLQGACKHSCFLLQAAELNCNSAARPSPPTQLPARACWELPWRSSALPHTAHPPASTRAVPRAPAGAPTFLRRLLSRTPISRSCSGGLEACCFSLSSESTVGEMASAVLT